MALLFSIVSSVDVQAASKYTLKTNPDKKITLAVGESCYPGLFLYKNGEEVFSDWRSQLKVSASQKGIVAVGQDGSDASFTALKAGDVSVEYRYGNTKAEIKCHVIRNSLRLNYQGGASHGLEVGRKANLEVVGKDIQGDTKIVYTSSNQKVAKIVKSSGSYSVKAVAKGTAVITAKFNGKQLKTRVIVDPKMKLSISNLKVSEDSDGVVTKATMTVKNASEKSVTIQKAGYSWSDGMGGGMEYSPLAKATTLKPGESATITVNGFLDKSGPGLFVKYGTNERFVWFKADGSMEEYDWL